MRGSINVWLGYAWKWMMKTNHVCQRFGVLFAENMKVKYVATKIL